MADVPNRSNAAAAPGAVGAAFVGWTQRLAESRTRTARLRDIPRADDSSDGRARLALEELQLTYEELSVAEDELRVQNEELASAHALVEAERIRYRELFQQAPVPYIVTNDAGTIQDANQAAERLVKVPTDRLVGKPLVVFTRAGSRRLLRETVQRFHMGATTAEVELEITTRRGTIVPVTATASASRHNGARIREIRWLLLDQRPTRRRERTRREQAGQLDALVAARTSDLERTHELKDRLVAMVSHELRTPLAAIAGFTELLSMGLRGPLSEEQRLDIERIHRAYEHMARVVDDLLNYSKVTGGRMSFEVEDAALNGQLQMVTELVAQHAAERNVAVVVDAADADAVVHADPERLRQILLNLVGNAVKYTPPGGTVTVRERVEGCDAVIDVEDTGAGIPRDQHEHIFEPFVRLPRDAAVAGSGLGLAISREMARAMAGDLTVSSEVGVGSCFRLRLPRSTRLAGQDGTG